MASAVVVLLLASSPAVTHSVGAVESSWRASVRPAKVCLLSPKGATLFVDDTVEQVAPAVVALDASTGFQRWRHLLAPNATTATAVAGAALSPDGSLLLVTTHGAAAGVLALNASDGGVQWTWDLATVAGVAGGAPDNVSAPLVSPDGATVYVGSTSGLCVRGGGSRWRIRRWPAWSSAGRRRTV